MGWYKSQPKLDGIAKVFRAGFRVYSLRRQTCATFSLFLIYLPFSPFGLKLFCAGLCERCILSWHVQHYLLAEKNPYCQYIILLNFILGLVIRIELKNKQYVFYNLYDLSHRLLLVRENHSHQYLVKTQINNKQQAIGCRTLFRFPKLCVTPSFLRGLM